MNRKNMDFIPKILGNENIEEDDGNFKVRVRNSMVLENLGEINLVLTDKTGTLT